MILVVQEVKREINREIMPEGIFLLMSLLTKVIKGTES